MHRATIANIPIATAATILANIHCRFTSCICCLPCLQTGNRIFCSVWQILIVSHIHKLLFSFFVLFCFVSLLAFLVKQGHISWLLLLWPLAFLRLNYKNCIRQRFISIRTFINLHFIWNFTKNILPYVRSNTILVKFVSMLFIANGNYPAIFRGKNSAAIQVAFMSC